MDLLFFCIFLTIFLWSLFFCFFFFNDTATTEIYTLSLHDALPISGCVEGPGRQLHLAALPRLPGVRSEEHTSELQSLTNLVCRLLLEKKHTTILFFLFRKKRNYPYTNKHTKSDS